jgi:hypothetical protein
MRHLLVRNLRCRKRLRFQDQTCRWKVSATTEAPLACEVLEKPCTVILVEDHAIYQDTWSESFRLAIPRVYGMSYASIDFREESCFDEMVDEMKADLSLVNDAVLVARGPVASWCAQFYLESCPLQGLVMVDPVLFDQGDNGVEGEATRKLHQGLAKEDDQWSRILKGAKSRRLRIEPNAVPMLVLQTWNDPACRLAAVAVAKRHSDDEGPYGEVPVKEVQQTHDSADEIMKEVDNWIESII